MTPRGRVAASAALVCVLLVAAWARLADVERVLGSGEVIPLLDGDAAYHLLRIRYAVEHFPALPTVDPTMNWPYGGACPWADGFDLLGAALVRVAGGLGSRDRTDVTAALLPVLLGLLVTWAAMDLARRVARRGAGAAAHATGVAVAAGLVAALLPQAAFSSRYGRTDHHVAEALSMVLLAGWALGRPAPRDPGQLRWELAGAGAAAFACWTFTGGPLYVALAAPIVFAATIRERRPAWLGSGAPALLAGAAAAALLGWPALRQHGRLVAFQLPSLLQPALVAFCAVALGMVVVVARGLPQAGAWRRLAALAAGCAALALAAAVAWPGAAHELLAGVRGWLLRRDPWLASVEEFQPMWGGGRGLVAAFDAFLGVAGVAAPAIVIAGGVWAGRRSGARGWAFAALSAALLAMTFLQVRFGRVFAPFLAVNVALTLEAAAWVALRCARRARALPAATATAAILLAVADPRLRAMVRTGGPRELPADAAAALELRSRPGDAPEAAPGVIAHWGSGHLVALLSGRPVVVNGFGTYLDEQAFWDLQRLASMDAGAFDRWMERRRVGYLVTGAPFIGRDALAQAPGGFVLAPEAMRSLPMSPLIIAGSGVPERGVRHLEHLMPIQASAQVVPGLAFPLPWLWTYVRVPGARVVGRGDPGARVVIEIPFSERRRPHVYRAWGDVGAAGNWEIVVPLPTGLLRPTLRTAAAARVRIGPAEGVPLAISEDAVRSGALVPATPLPAASRG